MSHFLARLVQRTRSEVSTVRPALPAVTAPDPTATAWDEQVMVREADPLAATPQVPRVDPRGLSSAGLPRAGSRGEQVMTGDGLPRAVPARAPTPGAPAPDWLLAQPRDEPDALRDAFVVAAPDAGALPQAALPGAPAAPRATQAVESAAPAVLPGTLAVPGTPESLPEPPAAWSAAPAAVRGAAATPQTTPSLATAEPTRGAPASRVPPSTAARAGATEATPPRDPIAPRTSTAIAREAVASTIPALEAHARITAPEARPAAREATAFAPSPEPMLGRPPRQAGPLSLPARFDAAPRPGARPGPALLGAPPGLVRETATTVEVSIGRIEVRLPPRPPASAGTPPASPRRPVIGLAEYLRARDTGKTP